METLSTPTTPPLPRGPSDGNWIMPLPALSEVSVAVIGAGFIAEYHVNGLRSAGGAHIAALVGRRSGPTAERAHALAISRSETDYRKVLDDRSIDAVVIATPDDTHERIAIDALDAGKAVLLQKPMALDAIQCRNLIDAAENASSRLTVSFMHRYFAEVEWLRAQLVANVLGPIHSVRIRNATPGANWNEWFYTPGNVSGGVVMQLGVHGIDLCQHLFGPITEVSAQMMTARPQRELADGRVVRSELEDNVLATYRFRNGIQGSHEMSYTEVQGCDRFRLEVYGELGTAWLRTERGTAAIYAPSLTRQQQWVAPALPEQPLGQAHHRHWLSIVRGVSPADDTAYAGLASIEVAETIYRAARSGKRSVVETAQEQVQ